MSPLAWLRAAFLRARRQAYIDVAQVKRAEVTPADWAAVGGDFRAVGDDMRAAMKKYAAENGLPYPSDSARSSTPKER